MSIDQRARAKQETKRLLKRHFLPPLRYENLEGIQTHNISKIMTACRLHRPWLVMRLPLSDSSKIGPHGEGMSNARHAKG
jgi:hypothetical protein